jgi:hypothetical protein
MSVMNPVVTTGPAPDSWGDFGSALGGLLLGYGQARANLDLEHRDQKINTPDRVDTASLTSDTTSSAPATDSMGTVAGIPMQELLLLGIGFAGLILLVRLA